MSAAPVLVEAPAPQNTPVDSAKTDAERDRKHKAAVALVTRDKAFELDIVPLYYENGILTVAMAEPNDAEKLEDLIAHTRVEVRGEKLRLEKIREGLRVVYPMQAKRDETPIEQLFEQIIKAAVGLHATDVHIEPFGPNAGLIRLRIDSVLSEYQRLDHATLERLVAYLKVRAGVDVSERFAAMDGRMVVVLDRRTVPIRINFITGIDGQKPAIRIQKAADYLEPLSKWGLSSDNLKAIKSAGNRAGAFIVIAGPTNSGKTTLLKSMIRELDLSRLNVCSVEDPVEMAILGMTQVEVNEKAGISFASAIRAFLRQDPDLIFIGELRDEDTVQQALQASTTGLSLMATTHAKSAVHIVDRLEELEGSRRRIASTLTMGMSQRLVRQLCRYCKRPGQLKGKALDLVRKHIPNPNLEKVAVATGCNRCQNQGYKDRFAVIEVMEIHPDVADVIRSERSTPVDIAKAAAQHGYLPMMIDGLRHVLLGDTSEEELLRTLAYEDMLI